MSPEPSEPEQTTVRVGEPRGADSGTSPPGRLGRYVVCGRLGAGGMGEVLLVEDVELGRRVAAKILHEGPFDANATRRFVREVQVTGQLEHPSIMPVYDVGRTPDGRAFFTMKEVRGHDLDAAIAALRESGRGLSLVERLHVFLKICDAVAFAHSRGVVHRDLKPANVMIGAFGEVLVLDWGLARVLDAPDESVDGQVCGTPAYMPPEQAAGRIAEVDVQSDVYALGAILYQLLALAPPYVAPTASEVLAQVRAGPPPTIAERARGHLPPWELEAVVSRAMARDKADRYSDVPALQADVEAWLAGRVLSAARYTAVQRLRKWIGRHRTASAAVIATLACAIALGAGASWRARRVERADLEAAAHAASEGRVEMALDTYARVLARAPSSRAARDGRLELLWAMGRAATGTLADPAALRRAWIARGEQRAAGEPESLPRPEQQREHAARIAHALAATVELDRALRLEPSDPPLQAMRRRAGEVLGWLALLAGEHSLAGHAFATLADHGLPTTAVRELAADVERDRTQRLAWWEARTCLAIDDLRAGLDRDGRPAGAPHFDDWLVEISGYRDSRVAALLGDALQQDILAVVSHRGDGPGRSPWTNRELDVARFTLHALGKLALAESVVLLATALERLETHELRVEAGIALCNTRRPEANGPLLAARDRLGNSSTWRAIERRIARVPNEDLDAGSTAAAHLARGHVRVVKGDLAGALEDYDRAIALDPSIASAWADRALARSRSGDVDGALADLNHAIELDPDRASSYGSRANAKWRRGDLAGALADLDRCLALDPSVAPAWCNRANMRVSRGDAGGALADYDRAIALDPGFAVAFTGRGVLRRQCGDPAGGLVDLERAIALDPRDGAARVSRAIAYLEAGDRRRALADFDEAISLDPRHARAYGYRGTVRGELGDVAGALADMDLALRLDPRDATVYVNRGKLRGANGDREGGLADCTRAIELDPGNATAWSNRAWARLEAGDRDGALADLDRAIELGPRAVLAYLNRAKARRTIGDVAGAIADYDRALALDPAAAAVWYNRGNARQARGDLDGAIADFTEAIRLEPNQRKFHENRGSARLAQGDLAGAAADYDETLRLDPRCATAYYNRGWVRKSQRDLNRALADFAAALALEPDNAQFLHGRGAARLAGDDLANALADFDRALAHSPELWEAWANRGVALGRLNRTEEALESFDRALAIVPTAKRANVEAARARVAER